MNDSCRTSKAWRIGRSASVVSQVRPSTRASWSAASRAAAVVLPSRRAEEVLEQVGVESERGRDLPQDRTQLLAECEQARRREEVGERRSHVIQLIMWVMKRPPLTENRNDPGVGCAARGCWSHCKESNKR